MLTIEQMVEAVVKRITTTTLGETALHPEKAAQLVRELEFSTPMLGATRRLDMKSDKRDIDRIGFTGRLMNVAPAEGEPIVTESTPAFTSNELSVVKAVGVVELSDESLEDNIERENFEDTLIALIGSQAGIDLEELYLNGDVGSGDPYLALTDGWNVLANNQITGAANLDFTAADVESMFEAMLVEILTNARQFMRRRQDMKFWVSWKAENDYRELLRQRGTDLGDSVQTKAQPLAYKGIPVVPVFNMPITDALMATDDNLVYGIRRDIRLEPERQARAGRTDFVVTFRTDAHYEDETGAVHATGYAGP
ncbi:hypothetical protein LCGC14_0932540 [marine sediment metagenome]|uniref:Phage major capsid protein n=1 Tax=marine sediment metagenome TaxID=412755 RepID=A0A0F9NS47_9ZZZZ